MPFSSLPSSAQVANVCLIEWGFRHLSFAAFKGGCQTCSMKVLCRPICPRLFGKTSARASGFHSPSPPSRSTASRCRPSHVASCGEGHEAILAVLEAFSLPVLSLIVRGSSGASACCLEA